MVRHHKVSLRFAALFCLTVPVVLSAQSSGARSGERISLSGQVVLADGTPPPEMADIETVCDGQRKAHGKTKPDGSFYVTLGGSPTASLATARDQGPNSERLGRGTMSSLGHVDLTGCELRAVLPGYTSTSIQLGRRSAFENPEVGNLILTPYGEHGDTTFSETSLEAPAKAKKAYENGIKEGRKDKPNWEKAAKELGKAVEIYPDYAEAWYELGEARLRTNEVDAGKQAFLRAIEIDEKFQKPYAPLALIELKQGNKEDAAKHADKAVELNPGFTETQFYSAMAHFMLGDLPRAAEAAAMVRKQGGEQMYPRVLVIMGDAATEQNDAKEAAKHYGRYLELEPDTQMAEQIKLRLAEWKAMGVLD